MATGTVTSRSAGVVNTASGSLTGDATATTITLGFKPRHVIVFNATDAIKWEKVEGMAAATSFKTVTAGTQTADTGSAILINSDNSTITLSATLAAAAKAISWVAYA